MSSRKQAKRAKQHQNNLQFLQKVVVQGGPLGWRDGRRFNFLLRLYHCEISIMAEVLNPAYYESELKQWVEHPERIPRRINPRDLPIHCVPTQEDRFFAATFECYLTPFALELLTKGNNWKQVSEEAEQWGYL